MWDRLSARSLQRGVGRGVSLALSILAISPAASGAAIVLDLVSMNYITVNLVD